MKKFFLHELVVCATDFSQQLLPARQYETNGHAVDVLQPIDEFRVLLLRGFQQYLLSIERHIRGQDYVGTKPVDGFCYDIPIFDISRSTAADGVFFEFSLYVQAADIQIFGKTHISHCALGRGGIPRKVNMLNFVTTDCQFPAQLYLKGMPAKLIDEDAHLLAFVEDISKNKDKKSRMNQSYLDWEGLL